MAMPKKEIREWLDALDDDAVIGIDEGGLSLVVQGFEEIYCEVGGMPEEDEVVDHCCEDCKHDHEHHDNPNCQKCMNAEDPDGWEKKEDSNA